MRTRTIRRSFGFVCSVAAVWPAFAQDIPANVQQLLDAVKVLRSDTTAASALTEKLGGKAVPGADPWADLLAALKPASVAKDLPAETVEFFESKIRPVLVQNCYECHGPDKQKASLRLDSHEGVLKGGESGPVIDAANPHASALLSAISYEGELKMPPSGKLPDDAIDALRTWIDMGAPWPAGSAPAIPIMEQRIAHARNQHWAFQPIAMPNVPTASDPVWNVNPVDAFVLSQLDAKGIKPSPAADKFTLIRRLAFDLTGLPPTQEEITAFEQDNSPEAYEKVVDRLLASPRYGERWGRYWLDVARYADTRGYVFQRERTIPFSYTYRDYVIRAFNEDLPYDTFIKHQLAADQLDLGEDKRPLAAMGFLTLNRHFLGNIHDITDDRIDVVTRGLMGLTVACARCHDHKYDPVTAADYYALYGVFRSSVEPDELPLIKEPDANNPQYQDFLAKLKEAEAAERALVKELHVALLTHAREKVEAYLLAAYDARNITDEGEFKTIARDRELRWQLVGRWRDFLKKKSEAHDRIFAPWTQFAALAPETFAEHAAQLAPKFAENKDGEHPLNPRIAKAFEGEAPKSMAEVAQRYATVLGDADGKWKDLISSETQLAGSTASPTVSTVLPDANDEEIRQVLYAAETPANVAEKDLLAMYDVPTQNRVRDRVNAIDRVKSTHPGRPDRAMALVDASQPFNPHVFLRGNPGNKGDDVPRRYLAVLSDSDPKPFEKGSGRLELANAIANGNNPLTARVWVNRVWMEHFDRGIVDTPSDFGVRTEKPVHADLLDYLAARFIADGWSTKKLHKLILTSNAYKQISEDNPDAHAIDPENRLFWKHNRQRLDFEALRDSILAAAGTIDLNMGGPSVDIIDAPFTTRRTIYSFIERQNLPGMFRTFDFANPDTHSPRRFRTTVPQQALFMLNGPFVIEQSRKLAARPEVTQAEGAIGRAKALYGIVYNREPDAEECALAEKFIADQTTFSAVEPPAWQYGFGSVDEANGQVTFVTFAHYIDGQWRAAEAMPNAETNFLHLGAGGGHPGKDNTQSTIRRWTAPRAGTIVVEGLVKHNAEEGQGDGIVAYVVSNRSGVAWKSVVNRAEIKSDVASIVVETGDTIDFIVSPGPTDSFDSHAWAPVVRYTGDSQQNTRNEWRADVDFSGPLPLAMTPWERFAQVLLASNEFAFVD
ncbi:MAG: PSD1 domain-containing protein [Candidatus Hydrogenedentes bacterium]|nr:PSD1 domain-containing protein [Candidatus Hydrogenedentota bacterium]